GSPFSTSQASTVPAAVITHRTSIVPATPLRTASCDSLTSGPATSTGTAATTSSEKMSPPPPHGGVAHSGPPPPRPPAPFPSPGVVSPRPGTSFRPSVVSRAGRSTGRWTSTGVRTVLGGPRRPIGGFEGGVPGLPPPPREPGFGPGQCTLGSGAG